MRAAAASTAAPAAVLAAATWSAVAPYLDELLAQPPEQRAAWLDQRADLDQSVVARLRRMLRADAWARQRSLLDDLPRLGDGAPDTGDDVSIKDSGHSDATRRARVASLCPGDRIGPFTLEREAGAGGMSEVWLASYSDRRMERKVALKLPHAAAPGRAHASRFERERDILSTLEHPNIARLYDAGVTDAGRVWLAMEYVEGTPIDRHCDDHALTVAQRVELFLQVVAAVHFAHTALVVHRDLKPSNVLVNQRGEVRLLDFGIARLLEPSQAVGESPTELDGGALTPAYAAPEQFVRGPITTATDVYSLGVLLSVLLTGSLPHRPRRSTRASVEEAIVQGNQVEPSSAAFDDTVARARGVTVPRLRAQLRGEIDTIVLKALKRNAAERYASADALALDLQRHLRGEPIAALPDTWWYRTAKFAQRHRLGVTLASTTAAVVVAAGAIAVVQYIGAQDQRRQATAVKEFLGEVLAESEPPEGTGPMGVTGKSIVDAGVARADSRFADQPSLHGELLVELGRLYWRHGERQLARSTLERGIGLLEANAGDALRLSDARATLAGVLMTDPKEHAGAQALARQVLADCAQSRIECARPRAFAERVVMHGYNARGELAPAIAAARRSLAEFRRGWGDADPNTSNAWEQLAVMLRNNGQYAEARAALDEALARGAQKLRAVQRQSLLLASAVAAADAGHYADSIERFEALQRDHPTWTGPRASAARVRMLHAMVLANQGLAERALAESREGIALARTEGNADIESWTRQQEARALSIDGRHDDAIAQIGAAIAHFEKPGINTRSESPRRHLGELLARAGRHDEAHRVLTDNLAHLRKLYPDGHLQIAQTEDLLGAIARVRGDFAESGRLHDSARRVLTQRLEAGHPLVLRNATYVALNEYAGSGGAEAQARAATALETYASRFPSTSSWHRLAVQAKQRLDQSAGAGGAGPPAASGARFADVILAH